MDLFKNKKLKEKEGDIQRLQNSIRELKREIEDLKSINENLKDENDNEAELHREVVDKMIGEIRAFISANQFKNLTYTSLETLYPLAKDILEKESFLLKIKISHFFMDVFEPSKKKDFIVVYSKFIVDKLTGLGLIDLATVESFEEKDKDDFINPHMIYRINTKYSSEDLRKKIVLLNTNTFEMDKVTFKEMSITKDRDCLILSLKNVQRRKRGFL